MHMHMHMHIHIHMHIYIHIYTHKNITIHARTHHDRSLERIFSLSASRLVLELEADGQLEIQLHSSALMNALHRIEYLLDII